MRRVIKSLIYRYLKMKGYTNYACMHWTNELVSDLYDNKDHSLAVKLWWYRKGFVSAKIGDYGLTKENYGRYLTDFDYHKMYPLNNKFSSWIDDKLTLRYMLDRYSDYLPNYYFHLTAHGEVVALQDYDAEEGGLGTLGHMAVIKVLQNHGELAFKKVADTFGRGFYKFSYKDGMYYINGSKKSEEEVFGQLKEMKGYLVTEFVRGHSELEQINPHAVNTLRFMVIRERGQKPVLANAFIRFGTAATGAIDNAHVGGLIVMVDVKDGRYHSAKRKVNEKITEQPIHPDTDIKVEGYLPNYRAIVDKILEISEYLSEVTYMGYDIAITEEGFKILEINSHQGVKPFQIYYPLLVDNRAEDFFMSRMRNR